MDADKCRNYNKFVNILFSLAVLYKEVTFGEKLVPK